MANTYLTISMITREALMTLENHLTFTNLVNREYDNKFGQDGAKIGDTVNVRKPPRYVGRTGDAMNIEDATETSVPVKLDTLFGVDLEFGNTDLLLSIDDFKKRFLTPATATIANKMDSDGLALYKHIPNSVGTPGTVPNALLTYLLAGVALDNEAAPQDESRSVVIRPLMQATIVNALTGLFQKAEEIARQYVRGTMGTAAGFTWYMDQNCATHTVGAQGGTPAVTVAGQSGASLLTDGWTAAAATRLKQGDVFTIAGVNSVNPQNRQSTGSLRQFVATADVASDGAGLATIPIYPPITVSGAFQTVDALPAAGALITVVGAASTATPQGLALHRDAFCLATADLPVPKGLDMAGRMSDKQLGISIRLLRDYTIQTNKHPCRMDVLYGWQPLRKELACRVQS